MIKRTTTTDEGEIEQVETFDWENEIIVNHTIFDSEGNEVIERDAPPMKPNQTRITTSEKGQVITEEELDGQGEVIMTIHRTYDEDEEPDEVQVYIDGRGNTISQHYFLKYEYAYFE